MSARPNSRGEYRLSKSKLAAFQHCPKRLWLQVYRRELAIVDRWTLQLFEAGHRVGQAARFQVPNGILLDPDPANVEAAIAETRRLIDLGSQRPLFEAAFVRDDVIVRVDILEPSRRGTWSLVEVKNSKAVRPYQLHDVATQAWVVQQSGIELSKLSIRHPSEPLRPWKRPSGPPTFIDVDVTGVAARFVQGRELVVAAARQTLRGPEPDRPVGPHCTRPFRCEFRSYCSRNISRNLPSAGDQIGS